MSNSHEADFAAQARASSMKRLQEMLNSIALDEEEDYQPAPDASVLSHSVTSTMTASHQQPQPQRQQTATPASTIPTSSANDLAKHSHFEPTPLPASNSQFEAMSREHRVQELEAEVRNLRSSYDALFQEYRSATQWISGRENHDELQKQNAELQALLIRRQEHIDSLEVSMRQLTTRLVEMEKSNKESATVQKYDEQLATMRKHHDAEVTALRQRISFMEAAASSSTDSIPRSEQSCQTETPYKATLQSANSEIKRLVDINAKLEARVDHSSNLRAQLKHALEDEIRRRNAMEIEFGKTHDEMHGLRQRVSLLMHDLSQQETELRRFREENQGLRIRAQAAESRSREREEESEMRSGEVDTWRRAYIRLFVESEQSRTSAVQEMLAERRAALKRTKDDFESKIKRYRDDREKLKAKIFAYKKRLQRYDPSFEAETSAMERSRADRTEVSAIDKSILRERDMNASTTTVAKPPLAKNKQPSSNKSASQDTEAANKNALPSEDTIVESFLKSIGTTGAAMFSPSAIMETSDVRSHVGQSTFVDSGDLSDPETIASLLSTDDEDSRYSAREFDGYLVPAAQTIRTGRPRPSKAVL